VPSTPQPPSLPVSFAVEDEDEDIDDMLHTPRGVPSTPQPPSSLVSLGEFEMEIRDFENFEKFVTTEFDTEDLSAIASMDFSQFLT
jgi:hypothetical protein